MRISYSWLCDYLDLAGVTPHQAAAALTVSGTKVESVHVIDVSAIVVGRILRQESHPRSRNPLWIHEVDLGSRTVQIIAGAPNAAPGSLVPVAPPGTTTPSGKFVQPGKVIAGVTGEGMLCSQAELGLGDDHSGILVLEEGRPGQSLGELFPSDAILEAEVTSNRPDCLGHLGIARELAAMLDRELRWDFMPLFTGGVEPPGKELVRVAIEAPELCRRYIGAVVSSVAVGPSPAWMQRRLRAAGMRPISNVVDVTNYVLLEYGQPLHAFDLGKLEGPEIRVRRARHDESLACLDGQTRVLREEDLVIADRSRPVAIAGVMGGVDSAVTESSERILLEAANFDGVSVRATSRALALRTESSARFEKGLAPELALAGARRAIQLLRQVAGGEVHRDWADEYPRAQQPIRVRVWPALIGQRLGVEVPESEAEGILGRLGFNVTPSSEGGWDILAPVFRLDVTIPADIVEEVGRIYGCDRIPPTLPGRRTDRILPPEVDRPLETLQELLLGAGFSEAITPALVSRARLESLGVGEPALEVANPLSDEMNALRTSLLPSLLTAVGLNRSHGRKDVRLFEIARVYLWRDAREQPDEPRRLAAVATVGDGDSGHLLLKAIVDRATAELGHPAAAYEQPGAGRGGVVVPPLFHPGRAARVSLGGAALGWLGELHPGVLRTLDLDGRIVALELDTALLEARSGPRRVHPIPRFPAVSRDLAVVVHERTSAGELLEAIREAGGPLLEEVTAFDEYRGSQVGEEEKSVAFGLTFRAQDRTLTDTEVDEAMVTVTAKLRQHGGRIRG